MSRLSKEKQNNNRRRHLEERKEHKKKHGGMRYKVCSEKTGKLDMTGLE